MRVLIVDDTAAMRALMKRCLRQAGYMDLIFEEASNGDEALARVRSFKPDLVLSDWNMPVMTGIDLLRALKAAGSHVKFGFVTSEGSARMQRVAGEEGALFFITKPFTAQAFRAQIDPVLLEDRASRPAIAPHSAVASLLGSFPTSEAVRRALSGLLSRDVRVERGIRFAPSLAQPLAAGLYSRRESPEGRFGAVCLCDLAFAANAGGALALVPVNVIAGSLAAGALTPGVAENLGEIFNVLAGLLAPMVLRDVVQPCHPLPQRVLEIIARPKERIDLLVAIPEYGVGALTLLRV